MGISLIRGVPFTLALTYPSRCHVTTAPLSQPIPKEKNRDVPQTDIP